MSHSNYTLAIVGARTFRDADAFEEGIMSVIEQWGLPSLVVSGGAAGADTMGEKWARENNIPVTIFYPDWRTYGKNAGILRNTDIVQACDKMLAFPSKKGRGTQDSLRKAKNAKKEILVFWQP